MLVGALAIGTALRVYPLHVPYFHPDEELAPAMALCMLAQGSWIPPRLLGSYPGGFTYLLQATYALAGAGGLLGGASRGEPADLVAAFMDDPFPAMLLARIWSCAFGIATIALVAVLGRRLFDRRTGSLAALLLAIAFLHVRESHWGYFDTPATTLFVATLAVTTAYVRSGSLRTIVAAGALAGLTAAFRFQPGVVALAVPAAVLLGPGARARQARALALAALAGALVFAVVTPHVYLRAAETWQGFRAALAFVRLPPPSGGPVGIGLPAMLRIAVGPAALGLAAVGLAATLAGTWRAAVPVLLVAGASALPLATSARAFLRYALPLVPLIALFAARGITAVAGRVQPRAAGPVAVLLTLAAIADPAWRSVQLDRLLATPDTRTSAGVWLAAHHPPSVPLVLPVPTAYANPNWGASTSQTPYFVGPACAKLAAGRGTMTSPPLRHVSPATMDLLRHDGGIVVTTDHPFLPQFARMPDDLRRLLAERGTVLARFDGLDASIAHPGLLYEPLDAMFVPMSGFAQVSAPGPNIAVWAVRPTDARPAQ
jgi:hypothetical protein